MKRFTLADHEASSPEAVAHLRKVDMMKERLAAGLDPLTGKPFKTCGDHRIVAGPDGGPVCNSCGRSVTLDEAGQWEHVE